MSAAAPARISLAKVALPTEHGGWSLTLEPVLLGLIVAPSWAGAALGAVALLGFLVRTPLKLSLGDRWRGRHLPRTAVADRIAAIEAIGIVLLVAAAVASGSPGFWWPLLAATPLFVVELWHDVRAKSRHFLPEMAGTIGIGSVAAAIALAGEVPAAEAWGLWAIVAARAMAAIPFVRVQLRRAKGQPHRRGDSDVAQALALALIAATTAAAWTSVAAAGAIAILGLIHAVLVRSAPPRPAVLGAQQVVLGLAVVTVAGLAAAAP